MGSQVTRIAGMMRVRNEARWIRAAVGSILPVCEQVLVLDDRSEDRTPEICRELGDRVRVIPSPFTGLDERRDKNYLLGEAEATGADWCISIDGDEILERRGAQRIAAALDGALEESFSLRIVFLWNSPVTVRTDGVYGCFERPSIFRLGTGAQFPWTGCGGQFHCGNVPAGLRSGGVIEGARLFHLGYLWRSDRLAKYRWYTATDPNNEAEDGYLHIVQGDVAEAPAHARRKHAGPLRLERIR
jgi:glycosyltransferase involved in cell wall biosynthesis